MVIKSNRLWGGKAPVGKAGDPIWGRGTANFIYVMLFISREKKYKAKTWKRPGSISNFLINIKLKYTKKEIQDFGLNINKFNS